VAPRVSAIKRATGLVREPSFCRNRNVMGALVNHRLTTAVATVVVALIVSLNVFLLYRTFFS
jgi:manganese transport protein